MGTKQHQSTHRGPVACRLGCNLADRSPKPPARLQTLKSSVSKLNPLTPIAWYQHFQGQAQCQVSFNPPSSATCYGFYQGKMWLPYKVISAVDQLLQPRAKPLCSAFLASYSPAPVTPHATQHPGICNYLQSSRQKKS